MKNYPYEIAIINCDLCEKKYFKALASYVKDECTCFDCFIDKYYKEKKEESHRHLPDLFFTSTTLTSEHLYLLGRLYRPYSWSDYPVDEDATTKKQEYSKFKFSDENINSINLLKLIVLCNDVYYKKVKNNHYISINNKLIEEIITGFNFNKIKVICKSEERLVLFLRGVVETYGNLITSDMSLKITVNSMSILNLLMELNNHVLVVDHSLIYEKLNCIDFLGKIYKNHLYFIDTWFYKQYVLMIDMYSSNKTSFSYCKILKVDKEAVTPFKTNLSDVGFDLTIIKKVKDLTSNTVLYDTGIVIDPPKGFYVEIHPRSSLSKSGYMLANSTGIIDPGYRNTLMIALTKIDEKSPNLELPFKCCQMIIKRHELLELVEVMDINAKTSRGIGGFGSTG